MLEDKIKKELFETLADYVKTALCVDEMEKGFPHSEDVLDSLMMSEEYHDFENAIEYEEYADLLEKFSKLYDKLQPLLVRSKYSLLLGLNDAQKTVLGLLPRDQKIGEKYVEEFVDEILELRKDEMIKRWNQIEPLTLTVHIHERMRGLYRQVVKCYVDGAFEASCVLCRGIVELIAKKHIEDRGFGDLLSGKDRERKSKSVAGILKDELSMPKDIVRIYREISHKADYILHDRDAKTTEEHALKSIELLQSFIEKFPKTV